MGNIQSIEKINNYTERGFSSVIINRIDALRTSVYSNKFNFLLCKFRSHILNKPDGLVEYASAQKILIKKEEDSLENVIPCIIPGFDHSPRSGIFGLIIQNSTPKAFYKHCKAIFNIVNNKHNKFIILRSWNEWGEGNYLEPDIKYGKSYIEMLRKAMDDN